MENISFTKKLLKSGYTIDQIIGVINNPIMLFAVNEQLIEDNVFVRTRSKTFIEALDVLESARSQIYIK